MAFVQALLKTLSAGVGALAYLFMYWKTRNLWGIAIMHGALDFIASIPEALFRQEAKDTTASYVSADAQIAMAGMIVLGVDLLINIIIVVWIWKKHMKDVDFEEIRRTW
jgi:membrane protease YdiL (CAAX protease family)